MVLANGPYSTFGRSWVLKRMPSFFELDEECFSNIPTWIILPELPLECWNAKAFGKIASKISEPVATDKFTAERSMPSYARILLEVDTKKPLIQSVSIRLPNGKRMIQVVEYEYEPKMCTSCHRVGTWE